MGTTLQMHTDVWHTTLWRYRCCSSSLPHTASGLWRVLLLLKSGHMLDCTCRVTNLRCCTFGAKPQACLHVSCMLVSAAAGHCPQGNCFTLWHSAAYYGASAEADHCMKPPQAAVAQAL